MLTDPHILGNASPAALEALFEPAVWAARGELAAVAAGRGSAWFVGSADPWVLRHYRRGGLIARVSLDHYVWAGEARVRAFVEWRLLAWMHARGLPVAAPVAARYRRARLGYSCDLITRRIADAVPLSSVLQERELPAAVWRSIGSTIGQLHAAGVEHADLNAHNVLLDSAMQVSVVDFDRGRLRTAGGRWRAANLQRLQHSLRKLAASAPPVRFQDRDWLELLAGYG